MEYKYLLYYWCYLWKKNTVAILVLKYLQDTAGKETYIKSLAFLKIKIDIGIGEFTKEVMNSIENDFNSLCPIDRLIIILLPVVFS